MPEWTIHITHSVQFGCFVWVTICTRLCIYLRGLLVAYKMVEQMQTPAMQQSKSTQRMWRRYYTIYWWLFQYTVAALGKLQDLSIQKIQPLLLMSMWPCWDRNNPIGGDWLQMPLTGDIAWSPTNSLNLSNNLASFSKVEWVLRWCVQMRKEWSTHLQHICKILLMLIILHVQPIVIFVVYDIVSTSSSAAPLLSNA